MKKWILILAFFGAINFSNTSSANTITITQASTGGWEVVTTYTFVDLNGDGCWGPWEPGCVTSVMYIKRYPNGTTDYLE